jgi:hypothetical protein
MARTKGPIKGNIAFVCEENATTSSYIAEALLLTETQWNIIEAGGTFTGEVLIDSATQKRYISLLNGVASEVVITNVYIGMGNGTDKTFSTTFIGTQAKPTTTVITASTITGTTDVNGIITGTGIIGVVVNNASRTTITLTFTDAPATGTPILAAFHGSIDECTLGPIYIGKGNASNQTFATTLTGIPVKYEGFTVTASAITGTANASTGVITGTGVTSGSVTNAGVFTVTFAAAPALNVPVLVTYTRTRG